MKKVLALVLAASMILSLAACGGSKSGSQPAEGTTAAAASATTKSDPETLNVYLASEPAHLDPALNSSVDGGCLAVNSFEGLYRYNSEGKLEPACAESYEVSEDGTTYTFTMRDGLKWSNGEPLTAKDFEYSWKRAANPENAADYSYLCEVFGDKFSYETGLADDAVVASEDGKTLTVQLGAVCPYFLDLAAFPFFFPVYQETVEATRTDEVPTGTWANDAGDAFVCNGAYILNKWDHESSMVYVKNDNYWDADSVTVKTLNFMLTSNDTSAYTAYQSGDLDFIDSVPVDETAAAMKSDEFKILEQLGTYYIGFNYNSKLYEGLGLDEEQAKVFRHALCLLIDRQYIVDTVGQTGQQTANTFIPKAGADGNGGIFEDGTEGYFPLATTEEEMEANVEEAKKLLDSIGLLGEDGMVNKDVSFTYLLNTNDAHVKIAESIQADLAKVGINMSIDQQEWNVFLDTRKQGQFDIAREGWVMDYDDPINMLEMWTTNSGNNDCQFGRDDSKALDWSKYDDLITQIRKEADTAKRTELMHEAEDMLMDTWCVVPIYYYNDPYMLKGYVSDVYGTALGMKYFYHAKINAQ